MEIQGDATEAAFLVAENKVGIAARHKARLERIDEIPLTSEPKIISTHELHSQHTGVMSHSLPRVPRMSFWTVQLGLYGQTSPCSTK